MNSAQDPIVSFFGKSSISPYIYPFPYHPTEEELKRIVKEGKLDALRFLMKPNACGSSFFRPTSPVTYSNETIPLWMYCIITIQPACFGVLLECGMMVDLVDPHQHTTPLQSAVKAAIRYHTLDFLRVIFDHRGTNCIKTSFASYDKKGKFIDMVDLLDKIKKENPTMYPEVMQLIQTAEEKQDLLNAQFFF